MQSYNVRVGEKTFGISDIFLDPALVLAGLYKLKDRNMSVHDRLRKSGVSSTGLYYVIMPKLIKLRLIKKQRRCCREPLVFTKKGEKLANLIINSIEILGGHYGK